MGRKLREIDLRSENQVYSGRAFMSRVNKDEDCDERVIKVMENNRVYYRCTACGYTTGRTFNVARHYVRKHTRLQTPKTCTRCAQNFKTKGDFYEHRKECQDGYAPRPTRKSWLIVKQEPVETDICSALKIKEEPYSCGEMDAEGESDACDDVDAEEESDACDDSDVKGTSESYDEPDIKGGIRLLKEEELLKFEDDVSLSPSFMEEGPELYLGMDIEYNQDESILHDIHHDSILPSWALDEDIENSNESLDLESRQTLKHPHEIYFSHSFDIADS
ncbi:hypothetical protein QAD02_001236 [Eretmocerus hayati]|uniref:Uncharacterized protein n=1 Tax=Eretmocerus hayati TaxID=131215 RepID=A0ACC2NFP6_9HYME|nr:hypothetical protein QAD02_001236 [Eretmocerus hayati]